MLSTDPKSKFMDIIIIYPCRVVPFDSNAAIEAGYAKEVRVEREVGEELIGSKRAIEKKDFDPKKYPCPTLKQSQATDEPKKPKEGK